MGAFKISLSLMATILATGAALNIAGSGMAGSTVQKAAQFITKGYGV
jgi:hypothetical protein